MKEEHIDIAVLGGGCAGLQLIHQLAKHPLLQHKRVALLSDAVPQQRTWCFWSQHKHPLQGLVSKSWSKVSFRGNGFTKTECILPFQYHYINGESFFNYFEHDFIPQQSNLTQVTAAITSLKSNENGFDIQSAQFKWSAKSVFSSIGTSTHNQHRHALWQHFKGWFLKMDAPVFDDTIATLMDFSIPQNNDVRFIYILPFSAQEALVEATFFSAATYEDASYDRILDQYMAENYPGVNYHIERTEKGQISMNDARFSRFGTEGEVLIGTNAGMVKPTTGYAFHRISKDVKEIARSINDGTELKWNATKGRFRFYDRLLLGILSDTPHLGKVIFSRLFSKVPLQTVLRFLDEETSLWEELKIFIQLPYLPFIKQIFKQALR